MSDVTTSTPKRGFRLPSAYTILFALIVITALATWVVPAGLYELDDSGSPIPGTYHGVDSHPARILVDSLTGSEADPVVVDRQSGRPVDGSDFVFTAGPAASGPFRDRYHDRPGPHSHPDSRREGILSRVRCVPRGSVASFGDIDPEAPRLVGRVLHTAPADVPWHRIVRADGTIPQGEPQRRLLAAEGVRMAGDRVDLRARSGPLRSDARGNHSS